MKVVIFRSLQINTRHLLTESRSYKEFFWRLGTDLWHQQVRQVLGTDSWPQQARQVFNWALTRDISKSGRYWIVAVLCFRSWSGYFTFLSVGWVQIPIFAKNNEIIKIFHFVKMIGCNVDQRKSVFSDYVLNDVVLNFQQWYCEII